MADKDNTTSTPLYELRGQKISSLSEATNVSALDDAYLLLSIKDDNVAINKKISLTQLLRVLIGDDNVATQIKNLYDNFRVGTTSPEYMNVELVKQIFPEIYIELQPNISEKPENESEYLNNIRTMRTSFVEENALNELNEIVSEDGGLVTSKLLKYYMTKNYDVIMHRIDLIEGLFDDTLAIDTLREIIDWFVGYTNNESNLTALITRIEDRIENTATETLQSAKGFTTEEINKLHNVLNAGTDNGKQKFITGITQNNGKITEIATATLQQSDIEGLQQAISDAQYAAGTNMTITQGSTKKQINCALEGGSNITIDESTHKINCNISIGTNNSITINGTTFSLTMNNQGELNFSEYVAITISNTSGGGTLEIDSTSSSSNTKFKVTTNKTISSATWKLSNGNTAPENDSATTSGTSSQITVSQNNNDTITRKCTVSDDSNSATSSEITLKFTAKRYFLGYSQNGNLKFNNVESSETGTNINDTSGYSNLKNDLSTNNIYKKGFTGNGYWYMIWPEPVNIANIYFGTGTGKAPASGGWHEHFVIENANHEITGGWQEGDAAKASDNGKIQMTVNQYSTQEKYYVYRSDNSFTGQMNIQF